MNAVISGLDDVLCLMDDVLVFRQDEDEHHRRLMMALQKIQSAGVTLSWDKCEFGKKQLRFLGHIINGDGIRADPDKVSAIVKMDSPTNILELRHFWSMVNQLGKFFQNLAKLTQPLRQLLGKRSTWLWGPEQVKAFSNVKTELTKPTVLTLYTPKAPIKISASASTYGLGAVLIQQSESSYCICLEIHD